MALPEVTSPSVVLAVVTVVIAVVVTAGVEGVVDSGKKIILKSIYKQC